MSHSTDDGAKAATGDGTDTRALSFSRRNTERTSL